MFPKNSAFSKDDEQAEYEANLKRRALNDPVRPPHTPDYHREIEELREEFQRAQDAASSSESTDK
jgi:hypothetical protein